MPRCGNAVTEYAKGVFCENRGCRFALWRDHRLFEAIGKKVERETAAELLNTGRVTLTGCVSRKTGKTFDCVAVMSDDGDKTMFELEFPKNTSKE